MAVVGFAFEGGKRSAVDDLCGAAAISNAWDLGPGGILLNGRGSGGSASSTKVANFTNADAAFLALQFWMKCDSFSELSSHQAMQIKRHLAGKEDWSLGGYGSLWHAMSGVLHAKFRPGSACAQALLKTGDAFIVKHGVPDEQGRESRERTWSNGGAKGAGKNWLGMQLMLLRDELREAELVSPVSPNRSNQMTWTQFIQQMCQVDLNTGEHRGPLGATAWQDVVLKATTALTTRLPATQR